VAPARGALGGGRETFGGLLPGGRYTYLSR
jgi:hypothetical protein